MSKKVKRSIGLRTKAELREAMGLSFTSFWRFWTDDRILQLGMEPNEFRGIKLMPEDIFQKAIVVAGQGHYYVPADGIYVENRTMKEWACLDIDQENRIVTLCELKNGMLTEVKASYIFIIFKDLFTIKKLKETNSTE